MIRQEKLKFWIDHGYNVLFVGRHGVGKTSIIKKAFEDAGLKWKYFSAATMDPWVDFVGTPKEFKDENGISYLDLVRPKEFAYDQIEALFFDEFNRSSKKIRNSVMELIQFRSINGKKFNNLKVIWAAINPDDDVEYDVEKLDPAQRDRFHVVVELPYELYKSYFNSKFPKDAVEKVCTWWQSLSNEVKKEVSPRRVDYALSIFQAGGDIADVLPAKSGVNALKQMLSRKGTSLDDLRQICNDKDQLVKYLQNDESYRDVLPKVLVDKELALAVLPCLSKERVAALLVDRELNPWSIKERRVLGYVLGKNNDFFETTASYNINKYNNKHNLTFNKLKYSKDRKSIFNTPSKIEFLIEQTSRGHASRRDMAILLELISTMPTNNESEAEKVLNLYALRSFLIRESKDIILKLYGQYPALKGKIMGVDKWVEYWTLNTSK